MFKAWNCKFFNIVKHHVSCYSRLQILLQLQAKESDIKFVFRCWRNWNIWLLKSTNQKKHLHEAVMYEPYSTNK